MAKIETVSENIRVAKCVHTSVWTTLASVACLKVRTFYSPSHISSDSYPFLELIFASFWFLYVIICIDILPSAIQRVQMVIDSL